MSPLRPRLALPRTERLRRIGRPSLRLPHRAAHLRDPGIQAVLVLLALAAAGFVMFALGWHGSARTVYVPLQLPWLISGGIAGLALLGLSLGALSIHLGRRADAAHRAAVDDLVRAGATLAEDLRTGRRSLPGRRTP